MEPEAVTAETIDDANLSRADFAYARLRSDIAAGTLKPGDRLREVELSDRLAVSRTPVREALRRLVDGGLAERGRSGLAVRKLTRQEVDELYAVRAVLEGAAASFAAQHASAAELERMRDWAKRCRDADRADDAAKANEELHRILHGASHNRFLGELQSRFSEWIDLLPGTTYSSAARRKTAFDEHMAIISAIEARAPEAARQAASDHILSSLRARMTLSA